VVILGPDELDKGVCTVKWMETGDQREVDLDKLTDDLGATLVSGENP
jgi:histidyl-tRNA synthetase